MATCGDTVSAVVTTPAAVINAEQKRVRGRKGLFWLTVQGDGAHYRGEDNNINKVTGHIASAVRKQR